MDPRPAKRLHARALKLNAQRQSAENLVALARHCSFSFAPPPWRNREWLYLLSHLHVGGIDHHGEPVSALVSRLLTDHLIENFLKQNSFQVTTLEGNAAQYKPVTGGLRQDKHGPRQVGVSIFALHRAAGKTNSPGPLINPFHLHFAFLSEPHTVTLGHVIVLLAEVLITHQSRLRTEDETFLVVYERV